VVKTTLLLQILTVNSFFNSQKPVLRRRADRDDNNARQSLDSSPTLRTPLLSNSRVLLIFTKKRKEHQRVGGERVRPPNCVIAFVRAAESSTGWDSAVPIQLQWWPSCSKGDGVTDLWLKKDLLVVTTMAATQHHAPGMFVPRVYISPTSSPPRSLDMPGPGISNRSRSRCISCSDSNASLEDSSLESERSRGGSSAERCQAVNVSITKMVDLPHKRWDTPETPEDLPEDSDQHPSPGDI